MLAPSAEVLDTAWIKAMHPGKILAEHYLYELDISINKLSRELKVPANRISKIVNGERSITPDTALRLAKYFGTSVELWMNLQATYDAALVTMLKDETFTREIVPYAGGSAR